MAACLFVRGANRLDDERIEERILQKLKVFREWHRNQ